MPRKNCPVRFTVRPKLGYASFPVDMLRYDSCYPATGTDVQLMETMMNPDARVRRGAIREAKDRGESLGIDLITSRPFGPTAARWESFGWTAEVREAMPA